MEAARIAFPDESPEFTPLVFALDVFIPLSALYQESFWAPASNKNDDWWKSSILLVLLLTVLAAFARLAWWFENRIKSKWGGNFGPIGAGIVMALLVFVLGYIFVAGIACVFLGFSNWVVVEGLAMVDGLVLAGNRPWLDFDFAVSAVRHRFVAPSTVVR